MGRIKEYYHDEIVKLQQQRPPLTYVAIIIVLLAVIFFMKECGTDCPQVKNARQTDTVYLASDTVYLPGDTVFKEVQRPLHRRRPQMASEGVLLSPQPSRKGPGSKETADSFAYYSDTITNRDWCAVIQDTISRNRILARHFYFQELRGPMVVNRTGLVKEQPRTKLFVGGTVGFGSLFDAGPSVELLTKKEDAYQYTYLAVSKTHLITYLWKIRLK